MTNPLPHPIDIHVGARLRLRRSLAGLSQTELAAAIDVTFQQLRKYECGNNRISASKLHGLACALNTPVDWLFDRYVDAEAAAAAPALLAPIEGLALVKARIDDPDVQCG